jgi:glycosyltransferase involved in cell wall biosynthesis
VKPPSTLDPWDEEKGPRGIRLHYALWQLFVLSKARQLHGRIDFDLAHHVSWGTISTPPLLWKLPIPFVWGPVGGGQVTPPSFRRYIGSQWASYTLRTLWVKAAPFLRPLRQAARRSAAVLATNADTARCLKVAGAREVIPFIDNGMPASFDLRAPFRRDLGRGFNLLWAGRLIRRKALPLALEALSQVRDLPVRLQIAGEGPMKAEWVSLVHRLGLEDRTQFLGLVEWGRMPELYQKAHAFIFTSLCDSFPSQVVEAMSQSLPILTLDHQGVGDFVTPTTGIKVPVTTPEETVASLAQAIRRLVSSPDLCRQMGDAAWECAQKHTWDKRAQWMSRLYEDVVRARRSLPSRFPHPRPIEKGQAFTQVKSESPEV